VLTQNPNPRLVKVTKRPARVPANAPMMSQTMISPMEIEMNESFLLEDRFYLPNGYQNNSCSFRKAVLEIWVSVSQDRHSRFAVSVLEKF
jgi:hypothetical protein